MKTLRAVPFLDLTRHSSGHRERFVATVERVLDSGRYILGPEVEAFEAAAADFLRVRHAVGVSSGSDALVVALRACGVGPGDAVLTTPFSFFATVEAVLRVGATPRFVDVDPATLNLPPDSLSSALTSRTRAIVPVHLFGEPAEMLPLMELARAHGLSVIEDGAQAFGAHHRGRAVGTWGDAGCFSFHPSKILGAMGDGGLVITDDDALAARFRSLRQHGLVAPYCHAECGGNFRLDALQAAILSDKLNGVDGWIANRARHARYYDGAFADLDGIIPVRASPARESGGVVGVYAVRVAGGRREALKDHLRRRQIETAVYYPIPLHLQPALTQLGHVAGAFPEAERAAEETLALPVFPELEQSELDAVVEGVRSFFAR